MALILDDGTPMNLSIDEMEASLAKLQSASDQIKAVCTVICKEDRKDAADNSKINPIWHIMIRKVPNAVEELLELRVAVVGNVDAGKSTMLGVLTKGSLDDGRGKARVNLFRHKHEVESGRTSSVGMEILGYDPSGEIITSGANGRKLTWEAICAKAAKVITFIDLAGHERYLKTTVFGMTGCSPDFVMLMVGANAGLIGMSREHLGIALALNVPVVCVITKVDMAPANVLETTIKQLTKILKSPGCRKIPMFVDSVQDCVRVAGSFVGDRICPIFQVSNVTGQGLNLIRTFLNILPHQGSYLLDQAFEFQISDTFSVPHAGTVASGVVLSGVVHVGDNVLLGPDSLGQFIPTAIKSIQRKRVNAPVALAGQSASFALKKIRRSALRKGMVLVGSAQGEALAPPRSVLEFEAEVLVLYHSSTIIADRYQAMLHCGAARQTVKIVSMNRDVIRTGDRALVTFRFMQRPEYIKEGMKLLFREGKTKGLGVVRRIIK